MKNDEGKSAGRPVAVDPNAISASATEPAFIAPPPGAPVYYGFQILHDVNVDGFTLGKITDFEAEQCDYGDAFVIAPDDTRAGIVWEVYLKPYFNQILPPDAKRWGVWGVSFQNPMRNRENAKRNLESIVPRLREEWEKWKSTAS
jgi:hypothetical protein